MTLDESQQIEDLLQTWYGWQESQSVADVLTHWFRREDHTCRGYVTPQSTEDQEEANEAWIDAARSEQVQLCVDELPIELRAAIQITMMIKASGGVAVWRSNRVDDRHRSYQAAKHALWPMMLARDLVKPMPVVA